MMGGGDKTGRAADRLALSPLGQGVPGERPRRQPAMSRAPAKFARDPARSAVLSLVRGIRPAIVALALVFGDRAAADSLVLRGGEKLVGKVLAETPAEVTFV